MEGQGPWVAERGGGQHQEFGRGIRQLINGKRLKELGEEQNVLLRLMVSL